MSTLIGPNGSELNPNQIASANEQAEAAAFLKILREADDLGCENCKGLNFLQVVRLKKVSGLITGTGKDSMIPIPVYACADCGHVNKIFLSKLEGSSLGTPKPSPEVPERGIE